jgi:hypothetical protein
VKDLTTYLVRGFPLVAALAAMAWGCLQADDKPAGQGEPAAFASTFPSSEVPDDILGGAPNANLGEAAVFAWREFVALNWPARGDPRDTPDNMKLFGQPGYTGPLVWHTYRAKVEIFPGIGQPHGLSLGVKDFGYDDPPRYVYNPANVGNYRTPPLPAGQVPACAPAQAADAVPWINLDEMSQIGLNTMHAGISPATPFPGKQVLFMAKANRTEYTYVVAQGWYGQKPPPQKATAAFVTQNKQDPPPGSTKLVSFRNGTIEVKAAWRRLTAAEANSGRFHTTTVRFYENQDPRKTYNGAPGDAAHPCYVDQTWGLLALHIIHKTPTAPYFVFATFGQADNILDDDSKPVEDANGKLIGNRNATPFNPNITSTNATPATPQKLAPPTANCQPGPQLFFHELGDSPLPQGTVCVNRRMHSIPEEVIAVNASAHRAIALYNQVNKIPSSPWLYYKLVNVQYKPINKPVPGQNYTGPDAPTYYLANIVVETDWNLQEFSGRFSPFPLITDFNSSGTPFLNAYYNGQGYNMGGCMGCHGNAQVGGNDFSFIFGGQRVGEPEVAGPLSQGSQVSRKFARLLRVD